jgi:hypothetical protein
VCQSLRVRKARLTGDQIFIDINIIIENKYTYEDYPIKMGGAKSEYGR